MRFSVAPIVHTLGALRSFSQSHRVSLVRPSTLVRWWWGLDERRRAGGAGVAEGAARRRPICGCPERQLRVDRGDINLPPYRGPRNDRRDGAGRWRLFPLGLPGLEQNEDVLPAHPVPPVRTALTAFGHARALLGGSERHEQLFLGLGARHLTLPLHLRHRGRPNQHVDTTTRDRSGDRAHGDVVTRAIEREEGWRFVRGGERLLRVRIGFGERARAAVIRQSFDL